MGLPAACGVPGDRGWRESVGVGAAGAGGGVGGGVGGVASC